MLGLLLDLDTVCECPAMAHFVNSIIEKGYKKAEEEVKALKINIEEGVYNRVYEFCKNHGLSVRLYARYVIADFVRSGASIDAPFEHLNEKMCSVFVEVPDEMHKNLTRLGAANRVARKIIERRIESDERQSYFVMVFDKDLAKMMEIDY